MKTSNATTRVLAHLDSCTGGSCPTIWQDGADIVVQGYITEPPAGATVPNGETVVRMSRAQFDQLMQSYLDNGLRAVIPA